jgi:hypothetical protein
MKVNLPEVRVQVRQNFIYYLLYYISMVYGGAGRHCNRHVSSRGDYPGTTENMYPAGPIMYPAPRPEPTKSSTFRLFFLLYRGSTLKHTNLSYENMVI